MIVTRATISPKLGAINEVGTIVKDRVDERNGQGHRVVGTRTVWGANGTKFHITNFYESVGDADSARRKITASEQFQTFANALNSLVEAPVSWTLSDIIVPPARQVSTTYALRVTVRPALGKNGEMREVCRDWVNYLNGAGILASLAEQFWGSQGASFSQRLPNETLAGADETRKKIAADPEFKNFVDKLVPTMTGHPSWELLELIAGPAS